MKIHNFITEENLATDEIIINDRALVHQINHVLKLQVGERVCLGDGRSQRVEAILTKVSDKQVTAKVEKRLEQISSVREIILYCALIKRDNFEWVVQKATELGVSEIVPVICERTIKTGINLSRCQKIAKEAAEQSGRLTVPIIGEDVDLEEVLVSGGQKWFCDMDGVAVDSLQKLSTEPMAIFIGPEGGWTQAERDLARAARCQFVKFGNNVLRAETAAIVAVYEAQK